jgi:lysophospholipase L1-like esterase
VARVFPFLCFALAACTGGDPLETDDVLALDPDVDSWSPPTAPLPSVERVVFLGDSITAGFGIDNPANTYPSLLVENADARWPEFAGDDLTTRYGAPEVIDVSQSGAEVPNVLEQQIPALDAALAADGNAGPTLVFVTIGGNDLLGALPNIAGLADQIAGDIEDMALELTDPGRFPDGSLLLVTNIYEPTDGEGQADECFLGLDVSALEPVLDETNGNTRALAEELGFAWVDLRGHFTGHGWNHDDESIAAYHPDDPSRWLQSDCIHPNARGHHEIRRLFLAAVDNGPLTLWVP